MLWQLIGVINYIVHFFYITAYLKAVRDDYGNYFDTTAKTNVFFYKHQEATKIEDKEINK